MSNDYFSPAPAPPTKLGEYRVLCPAAGVRVSPLQLGGMSIGQSWSSFMGSMSKEDSFKLLDAFWAAGGNFIDTSNNYQDEESETWIGEWMEARGLRDQLVVATKFTSDFHSHAVGKGKGPNFCGNHRKSLHMSARASLAKLRTDYIDILYVHWWDYTTSIREIMDGLHFLVQQGKVLYLGASDMPAWVVSAANTYALENGKTPFSIYQGRWNLMVRDFERDIVPMARAFGMALAPWDVLGGGRFQSAAALEQRRARGETIRNMMQAGDKWQQTEDEARVSEALLKVAREHGSESVTAVALAYVMSKAPNVYPIVGGRRVEHLQDNIAALSMRLTDEQIKFLESVKPFDIGFPHDFLGPDPNITGSSVRLERASAIVFRVRGSKRGKG